MDRKRTGKTLSNKDWESPVDPDAKITKMKDGRTHLAYKPEHVVGLDTGAVLAVEVHEADKGDTATLGKTLEAARESLGRVTPTPPCPDDTADLVADKGHFSRDVFKDLDGGPWRTRIAEPKRNGLNSWRGDHEARRAVYNNRSRISSGVGSFWEDCGRNSWSAASSTPWTDQARCAGYGSGGGRTSRNATYSTWPGSTSAF